MLASKFSRIFIRSMYSVCPCPPNPQPPVVTLLDTHTPVGKNLALLLKQNPNLHQLRVYDEKEDCSCIAKDLNDIDTRTEVVAFPTNALKEAITGAHVIVSFGGNATKPGQSQDELFDKNVDSIRNVAIYLAEFNPTAIYCIAKPPVEALVPMASEEYRKASTYDHRKIIGIVSHASMIANTMIANFLKRDATEVMCPIVGGLSPKGTIPVISQTRPAVNYDSKLYNKLIERIANAEDYHMRKFAEGHIDDNIQGLSLALALARFLNSLLKAFKGDKNCVECAFVRQVGHIGEFLPYMTSIVKLGLNGIESTHMPKLNDLEIARLKAAVPHIVENIALGQSYVTGDYHSLDRIKGRPRRCDAVVKRKLEDSYKRAGLRSP